MKITTVSVNIRLSKNTAQGIYKTLELGAEATSDIEADWIKDQQDLYHSLYKQLMVLFNSPTEEGVGREKPSKTEELPFKQENNQSATVLCTKCEGNPPLAKFTRGGDTWYSHRLADGTWCRGV